MTVMSLEDTLYKEQKYSTIMVIIRRVLKIQYKYPSSTLCFPSDTEQFQTCHDNTAPNCRGNEVTGVSTARECCLGDGYWFQDPNLGGCRQCIGK